jgi:transcriptional regulator with XRE-family HTH domain
MSGEGGNPHTRLEIGRTLARAREERGLSLQQVEEATKIRTRYLRDLEDENFEVLPAVYMLGSLKTYAEYLGLDRAELAGEFKRRQASLQAEQEEARGEPPARGTRGLLAPVGRLIGIGETVKGEAGKVPDAVNGLYVSLAVVLIFFGLAAALASSIGGEDHPAVQQMREPTIAQIPSGVAFVGNVEQAKNRAEAHESANRSERQAKAPAKHAHGGEGGGVERTEPKTSQIAQVPSSSATAFAGASASTSASASANASGSASVNASPASAGSVSAYIGPATTTPVPGGVGRKPAAKEERGGSGRSMTTAPKGPTVRPPGGPDPRPGLRREKASSVDVTVGRRDVTRSEESRVLRLMTLPEPPRGTLARGHRSYKHIGPSRIRRTSNTSHRLPVQGRLQIAPEAWENTSPGVRCGVFSSIGLRRESHCGLTPVA